jgi:hypothetical protein
MRNRRLGSWKEIAVYLSREPRAVSRWEIEERKSGVQVRSKTDRHPGETVGLDAE